MTEQVRKIVAEVERFVASGAGSIAFRVYEGLVRDTPKDSGFARSRWFMTKGRPISESPSSGPSSFAAAASLARRNIRMQNARAREVRDSYRVGDGSIYIVNPTTYIEALNRGSSNQEPPRFVERGIERGLRLAARDLRRGLKSSLATP